MKQKSFHFAALALVLTGSLVLATDDAAKNLEPSRVAETAKLNETLTFITREYLKSNPDLATTLAIPVEEAGGKYSDRLPDYSEAGAIRVNAMTKDWLARLDAVDAASLAATDRIGLDAVRTAITNGLKPAEFMPSRDGLLSICSPYVVNQLDCAFTSVPDFLDSRHPLQTAVDAEDYLKRLSAYAIVLDQESARLEAHARRGVIPPDFAVDGAIKQLEKFAALPPTETVLVLSLARRLKALPTIDASAAAALVAQAEKITTEEVLPAYRRQIAALEAVRPQAPKEPGIWRLKGGDAYYEACLKVTTTSDLTPDQIRELGLKLVAKISAEADPLLKTLGYEKGTVAERLQALSKDARQLYPNTDAGRAELLADLNKQTADITAKMPALFGVLAKARVDIKRVPTYIEAGSAGGYYEAPALDGSRPGSYYINLRDTAEWPRFSLPTLTYHEAVPGHHWQGSIAQETGSLPRIRSAILFFPGYGEGWALYAEQLADEVGAYKDDPAGRVGYLQSMLFRAARLVVDTGIHRYKWTREQAIDYMVSVTGDQRSSLTTEVERYAVWPGQACAYMVGREEINRLRDKARAALGSKFDLRSFHDVLMTNGSMPLTVMARVVDQSIAAQRKSPAQAGAEKSSAADPMTAEALRKAAQRIPTQSIVVDGHNDIALYMTDAGYDLAESSSGLFHTDLPRLKQGGVGAQFFSVWIDPEKYGSNGGTARALKMIHAVHHSVAAHPDELRLATTVAEIRQAKDDGRIAALIGIEGGYAIEDSLETLWAFHRLGVRYMTLTHRLSTAWAGAATEGPGAGLTPFGRDVVREMNRLGMLVDVAHVSDATMNDVLDVSRVPVIASHSSARALCDVPRNIPDPLLRRIATNGGVVMVNFRNAFLDKDSYDAYKRAEKEFDALWERYDHNLRAGRMAESKLAATLPDVPLSRLVDHIGHIVSVAGIDHVGLGSDFDGSERTPSGMEDVSCYPNLTLELLRRGYSEKDIQKILGENFLRVLREAEEFARSAVSGTTQ
jgi:uncharacterized protein (DUF885 family)/microsomal dipeptidase-like Zn-dependent dipeptidase